MLKAQLSLSQPVPSKNLQHLQPLQRQHHHGRQPQVSSHRKYQTSAIEELTTISGRSEVWKSRPSAGVLWAVIGIPLLSETRRQRRLRRGMSVKRSASEASFGEAREWQDVNAARIDKVLFLGTGSAVPVPGKRNMSSLAIMLSTGAAILVDCGEGTQHHLRVSTILKAAKIEAILVTHLHGDHCYGLFGLLHSIAMEGRNHPIRLVGPSGLREMVETVMDMSGGWYPEDSFPLEFLEISSLDACGGGQDLQGADGFGPRNMGFNPERCAQASAVMLGSIAGLEVEAVPLVHSVPDWGYVFREPDRPGKLDATKAFELGVPRKSPMLGQLKKGQTVTLKNGRSIMPEEVVGPPVKGRTLAVLQDTCDSTAAIGPCREAECVIHEATLEASMEEDAISKGHSTSVMAATFAAACHAKRLVLTHFSARYSMSSAGSTSTAVSPSEPSSSKQLQEPEALTVDPAEQLGEEARHVVGDKMSVVVAKDFMVLQGDKDFEPQQELAVKRLAWHR